VLLIFLLEVISRVRCSAVVACGAGGTAALVNWEMVEELTQTFQSMLPVCFQVLLNSQQEMTMHAWCSLQVASSAGASMPLGN